MGSSQTLKTEGEETARSDKRYHDLALIILFSTLELFHTERTHVRNLKILYRVFYRPMAMQKIIGLEMVKLLFSNLDEVLEVHSEMKQKMRIAVDMWKRDSALDGLYGDIGELMEGMFDGASGERLMNVTAAFCQHQQHALDFLRQL